MFFLGVFNSGFVVKMCVSICNCEINFYIYKRKMCIVDIWDGLLRLRWLNVLKLMVFGFFYLYKINCGGRLLN